MSSKMNGQVAYMLLSFDGLLAAIYLRLMHVATV